MNFKYFILDLGSSGLPDIWGKSNMKKENTKEINKHQTDERNLEETDIMEGREEKILKVYVGLFPKAV